MLTARQYWEMMTKSVNNVSEHCTYENFYNSEKFFELIQKPLVFKKNFFWWANQNGVKEILFIDQDINTIFAAR